MTRRPGSGKQSIIRREKGEHISATLKRLRESRNLTQSDLALLMKVRQQFIAKLESPTSNPRIATLVKIGDALGYEFEIGFD